VGGSVSQLPSPLPKVLDIFHACQELILDSEPLQPLKIQRLGLWQANRNASMFAKIEKLLAERLNTLVKTVRA
jgi:hypothetical protein